MYKYKYFKYKKKYLNYKKNTNSNLVLKGGNYKIDNNNPYKHKYLKYKYKYQQLKIIYGGAKQYEILGVPSSGAAAASELMQITDCDSIKQRITEIIISKSTDTVYERTIEAIKLPPELHSQLEPYTIGRSGAVQNCCSIYAFFNLIDDNFRKLSDEQQDSVVVELREFLYKYPVFLTFQILIIIFKDISTKNG